MESQDWLAKGHWIRYGRILTGLDPVTDKRPAVHTLDQSVNDFTRPAREPWS